MPVALIALMPFSTRNENPTSHQYQFEKRRILITLNFHWHRSPPAVHVMQKCLLIKERLDRRVNRSDGNVREQIWFYNLGIEDCLDVYTGPKNTSLKKMIKISTVSSEPSKLEILQLVLSSGKLERMSYYPLCSHHNTTVVSATLEIDSPLSQLSDSSTVSAQDATSVLAVNHVPVSGFTVLRNLPLACAQAEEEDLNHSEKLENIMIMIMNHLYFLPSKKHSIVQMQKNTIEW
ncbi:uncharacterized protein BT62DRAFT_920117 [Guyanagaster necrorhizus]|uniref:Uncharacterized protein n=1 Tax=Guyanagaster necrorhizus TaxID=856835 RepID=A0A9P7VSL0_9AGAR|nr:uncharacterized protein BT62DRAFT_920117 [Guyanagaster necrorhizus MCA 3950]KAG7446072.1 hypothetical protein BT62DRAFT_920117 [Guyanagaster necrorhizus MCA 3950]